MQLEYYKLQKTFAGAIELEHAKGVYEPVTQKGALGHDPKEPLDEIILKINEKFKGEFTNADRVLLTALHDRLLADPKLAKLARSSDPQIFTEASSPRLLILPHRTAILKRRTPSLPCLKIPASTRLSCRHWQSGCMENSGRSKTVFPFYLLKTACIHRMQFTGFGCSQQAFCNAK